jgi:2-amino-4-hydroxy-6-hydroxymethyldihydropteridine diphosphokinase
MMVNEKKQLIVAYICLGSNLGDRAAHIKKALKELEEKGIVIEKVSSLYSTEPVEVQHQPWFLNLVAEIATSLSAEELLNLCQQVERKLGRSTKGDMAPRTIDIDILFYGDKVVQKANLQIPHPRMHVRLFMLEPLCEIAPAFVHPIYKKTISQLITDLKNSSKVIKLKSGKIDI